jgi:hypothetical protein
MNCARCGAPYLAADPECPRCGLPFPTATAPLAAASGAPRATRSSERPWILRGVSVVAVLFCGFLALNVLAPGGDQEPSTNWRPSDLPAEPGVTTQPPAQNLARGATVTADRTGDPGRDAAGRTITYEAQNMVDDDLETAWRASGYYSGESVTITLPARAEIRTVGLTNGYTKVDPTSGEDRYEAGRRIQSVTWKIEGGPSFNQDLEDGVREIQYMDIDPVQAQTIELRINQTTTPGQFTDDYTAITELFVGG